MKKRLKMMGAGLMGAVLMIGTASAHVTVEPDSVGIGKFQTFTTSVPSEGESSTVQVRLVIPDGLNEVTPTVKPGWTIEVKKAGSDGDARITEIVWSGGGVPSGQRDDFSFSAQAPAKATTLQWKAYQTYADSKLVSWDQTPPKPESEGNGSEPTPYSVTKVVDDLSATGPGASSSNNKDGQYALYLSVAALVVAVAAFMRKR